MKTPIADAMQDLLNACEELDAVTMLTPGGNTMVSNYQRDAYNRAFAKMRDALKRFRNARDAQSRR